jgi:hypothetical protein
MHFQDCSVKKMHFQDFLVSRKNVLGVSTAIINDTSVHGMQMLEKKGLFV